MESIILRNGEVVKGRLIRVYNAFEGGKRYIFQINKGEYRCIKNENGEFVEYTP